MIGPTDFAAFGSGSLVGLALGMVGGGGSILAVPLLVYVVGVASPHVAIGTSAVAVAASAFANLVAHARAGNVRWPCAAVFTGAGVVGAILGAMLGKALDGQKLLALFGALMIAVAVAMFLRKGADGAGFRPLDAASAGRLTPRLVAIGGAVGALSGFFGIGGGFLIVPGLILAADMPMLLAIGTSLAAVTGFGLTTALSYAWSGLVDWRLAFVFIAGGVAGGLVGAWVGRALAGHKAALTRVFAALVLVVGLYVAARGLFSLIA